MSETRKLVAILVADVVGYSRLAGADEERCLQRLLAWAPHPSVLKGRTHEGRG
jgi:hypothetical protein